MRTHLFPMVFVVGFLASAAGPVAAGPTEPRDGAGATVAVQRVGIPASGIRDEAAMVLVGTALIALGAAVRRVEFRS